MRAAKMIEKGESIAGDELATLCNVADAAYRLTLIRTSKAVTWEAIKVAVVSPAGHCFAERICSWLCVGSGIGHFGGLGGPGGSGDPSKRWRASPPTICKGLPGPRGRPDPRNVRFSTLKEFKSPTPQYSHAVDSVDLRDFK